MVYDSLVTRLTLLALFTTIVKQLARGQRHRSSSANCMVTHWKRKKHPFCCRIRMRASSNSQNVRDGQKYVCFVYFWMTNFICV